MFNNFFKKFKNRQFTDEKLLFSTRGAPVSPKFQGKCFKNLKLQLLFIFKRDEENKKKC